VRANESTIKRDGEVGAEDRWGLLLLCGFRRFFFSWIHVSPLGEGCAKGVGRW